MGWQTEYGSENGYGKWHVFALKLQVKDLENLSESTWLVLSQTSEAIALTVPIKP